MTGGPARLAPPILGAAELALLSRLHLVHRRPRRGLYPGQRRSPRSARSPEFADFRPYSTGDDLRQVDWRAFARFERLMLRLSVAEEESALNVVVDASESMTLGTPSKWAAARRLAGAVAVLGLGAMDRVAVGLLRPAGPCTPHLRRGAGAGRVLAFLAEVDPAGTAGPDDLARLRWLRPGLTVVISDFLVEQSWAPALAGLRAGRQEPLLWQVLAPEEEVPVLSGDVELRDVESDRRRELTVTPRLIQDYLRALAAHRDQLRRQAAGADGRFLHTASADGLESSMLAALRAGVVRRG